jgi:hypothetical protein
VSIAHDNCAEQSSPNVNAQCTEQPVDDCTDYSNNHCRDESRRKVGDTQSQVQPGHDHEDNGGNDDGDDKTQNNTHFAYLLFVGV